MFSAELRDTSFVVNVKQIDEQHIILGTLLWDLYIETYHRKAKKTGELFLKLLDSAKQHFSYEEQLMAIHHYPACTAHKTEHAKLEKKLTVISELVAQNEFVMTHQHFLNLKYDWLLKHIVAGDKELGVFLNSKGVY